MKSDAKVERRISCGATHIFMHKNLACEHVHLPGFPIGFGMFDWRSNIGLALAYKHAIDLLGEGLTIIDNLTSPSIYNRQFRNLLLVCVRI